MSEDAPSGETAEAARKVPPPGASSPLVGRRAGLSTWLEALLPTASRAELRRVALRWGAAASVADGLDGALRELGTEPLRVEATWEELRRNGIQPPFVLFGDDTAVVIALDERGAALLHESGRVERRAASGWSDAPHTFALLAKTRGLEVLRGKVGSARLWSYLQQERGLVGTVVLFALGFEALTLAVPITVQVLINNISYGMLVQPVVVLSLVLCVALTGAGALRLLQTWAVEHIIRRFVHRVALDIASRYSSLLAYTPFPAHRFFEIGTADKALFIVGLDLTGLALQVFAATLLLSVYHPILLGFALALGILATLALWLPFRPALRASLAESSRKYALADWLASRGESGRQDLEGRAHIDAWIEARKAAFRVGFIQQALLFLLEIVFAAALLVVGGRLVILGQLSIGQLVAAELVTTSALVSLAKLGKQLPTLYDLITSFEKLGLLVDHSPRERAEP